VTGVVVEGLSYSHRQGKHERAVLQDINVSFQPGAITVLTGPSGAGKSTLITIIGGLRKALEGSVRVLGMELVGASERQRVATRRQIGFIFQQHNLSASLSVRQNILMGLQLGAPLSRREKQSRIESIADTLGLDGQLDKYPGQLSGGQQQRAGIARALVNKPRLILADEPTASLDRVSGESVMGLLHDLAVESGATILLVTHDKRVLDKADALVTLEDGRIARPTDGLLGETAMAVRTIRHLGSGHLGRLLAFGNALAQVALADNELADEELELIRERLGGSGLLSATELEFVLELVLAMGQAWGDQHGSETERASMLQALEDVALVDQVISPAERAVIDSLMVGPSSH
jgi:putative ABC transport system ATP-binding protein